MLYSSIKILTAESGDKTVNHQGVTYVLAEPTGPASYLLGKIAPESELAINNSRYTLENFHAKAN